MGLWRTRLLASPEVSRNLQIGDWAAKIAANHDHCQHADGYADRYLAATIRNPVGRERFCAAEVVDDGQRALTVVLIIEGQEHTLILDELQREYVASEGWPAFLSPEAIIAPAA